MAISTQQLDKVIRDVALERRLCTMFSFIAVDKDGQIVAAFIDEGEAKAYAADFDGMVLAI